MTDALDQKYKQSGMPHRFLLSDVDTTLKRKFLAQEIDEEYFMKNDPYAKYDHVFKFYEIQDPQMLKSIFNEEEVCMHKELKESNARDPHPVEKEWADAATMWEDVQEGRLLRIVIESENGVNISSFTMQGICETVLNEILALRGIDPKDAVLENPNYIDYLNILQKSGYL